MVRNGSGRAWGAWSVAASAALCFAGPPALADADGDRRVARAVRAEVAPEIDGRLDDPVWQAAPWQGGFTQRRPVSGDPPSLETTFAVAFDEEALYIAVRSAVDGRDSIISRLTRRDRWGDFDSISITLAPRDDGRTGYSFAVNPDGVIRDATYFDDKKQDASWDAVWVAGTSAGDDEWIAELAIPLDQIRFPAGQEHFGIQVSRWISSRQENVVFNPVPPERSGWISATGRLEGLSGIVPRRPLSVTPEGFVAFRDETDGYGGRGEDGFDWGIGGYGQAGLGGDLVLDLAVNPDFGQVEVDEAVLNLTAYETRFPEKRPFFMEGAGVYATPIQLFYSRRLGAPPPDLSLASDETIANGPTATTIVGAAKLSGRTDGGLSVGMIEAVLAPTEFEIENLDTGDIERRAGSHWSNAAVLRLNVEPDDSSTFGLMATALNPQQSNGSYAGGVDWNLLTDDKEYAFRGQVAASLRYDEVLGREADQGAGLWAQLAREGGEHLRVTGNYQLYSDGFDPNDLGYLRRDDYQQYSLSVQLRKADSIGPFAQLFAGVTPKGSLNTEGLNLGQQVYAYLNAKWANDWVTEINGFGLSSRYDDRETRDGPSSPQPAGGGGGLWIRAAERKMLGGSLGLHLCKRPYGFHAQADLSLKLRLSRVEVELNPTLLRRRGDEAWVATLDEDNPRQSTIIGHRDLDEVDVTLRGSVAILRNLTFQLTTQLLAAEADYSHYELMVGRRGREPYDYQDDWADFARTDLVFQALLRWEYLPGSALYAVYTHFGFVEIYGSGTPLRNGVDGIPDEEREQLFMLKLSHRFG